MANGESQLPETPHIYKQKRVDAPAETGVFLPYFSFELTHNKNILI